MDLATFQALLARHGTDLDRWPGEAAQPALELMAGSGEARELFLAAFETSAEHAGAAAAAEAALVDRIMSAIRDV